MELRKFTLTRRELLQAASAAVAGTALSPSSNAAETPTAKRLTEGWEYYRGNLGSVWEAWRGKAASDNVYL